MKLFKSAIVYKITSEIDADSLSFLDEHPVSEPHETQLSVTGWRNAIDEDSDVPVAQIPSTGIAEYTMLCMVEVRRNIKPATIKRKIASTVKSEEIRLGRKLDRAEQSAIKEDVISDALPGALTEERKTIAYIDHKLSIIVINESSINKAEKFLSELRKAIGQLSVIPVCTKNRPDTIMNDWVVGSTEPHHVEIQGNAVFKDPLDMSKTAKLKHVEIDSDVVGEVINEGMVPQELELLWMLSGDIKMSFTLTDNMIMKSIELIGCEDDDEDDYYESEEDLLKDQARRKEASMIMTLSSISSVFSEITVLFGGAE